MKNRILLILTLAATAIIMSATGAYAAGLNVLSDFEADTDGIVIYFNKEVDEAAIKNAIELTENGTQITNLDVNVVPRISGYRNTNLQTPAYKITKSGVSATDFAIDTQYTLKINENLTSTDGSTLDEAVEKIFEINEILTDDFSGDTSKWALVQTNVSDTQHGNNTIDILNGKLQFKTGTQNAYQHILVPADYANMSELEDYTVEFDIDTVTKGSNGNNIRFGLVSGSLNQISGNSGVRFHIQNSGVRAYLTGNSSFDYFDATTSGVNYKFVAKDNRYVLYADDVKMYDYTTNGLNAKGVFCVMPYNENEEFHFDNFKMTKMREIILATPEKAEYDINEDVVIDFSSAIDTSMLQNAYFTIKAGNSVIEDFDVSAVDDDSVKIHFTTPLEYKTEYTVSVSDELPATGKSSYRYVNAVFNTIPPSFDLERFVNESGTVTAVVKNNREPEAVTCIATVVLYDSNNKMIGISGSKYTIARGADATIQINAGTAARAKCFVWSDFTGMSTLFDEEIVID